MQLHVHHSTSYSVQFYEICGYPYQGTNSLKCRHSNGNNSCISETIVTNFDVHQHTDARYDIAISFFKLHPLVTKLWLLMYKIN